MAHALNQSRAAEDRMNLGALQRVDPYITAIITSAKQVRSLRCHQLLKMINLIWDPYSYVLPL